MNAKPFSASVIFTCKISVSFPGHFWPSKQNPNWNRIYWWTLIFKVWHPPQALAPALNLRDGLDIKMPERKSCCFLHCSLVNTSALLLWLLLLQTSSTGTEPIFAGFLPQTEGQAFLDFFRSPVWDWDFWGDQSYWLKRWRLLTDQPYHLSQAKTSPVIICSVSWFCSHIVPDPYTWVYVQWKVGSLRFCTRLVGHLHLHFIFTKIQVESSPLCPGGFSKNPMTLLRLPRIHGFPSYWGFQAQICTSHSSCYWDLVSCTLGCVLRNKEEQGKCERTADVFRL